MKMPLLRMIQVAVFVGLAAQAENWCLSFPDDNVLMGHANVRGLRAIPALEALLDGQDRLSRMADSARQHLAVDLETVTDVWFGVSPSAGALSVLQGTYNLATVRGIASAAQNLRVSTPPGAEFAVSDNDPNRQTMVAFLSPREAVLGRAPQVEAFLENRAQRRQHARAEELASLETPGHLVECVMLGVPKEVRKVPPAIANHIGMLSLTVDGRDAADLVLTVRPRHAEMAVPLATWCQSSLELLRLLPPEQLAGIGPVRVALLKSASAASVPGGVALSAQLPVEMITGPLGRSLGTRARPAQPPP